MNYGLFLDRDGVINFDYGYVHQIEKFRFIPGIFDLVRCAKNLGFHIFVITNQAGIGRGYYTETQFLNLSRWMCERFDEAGASITKVYYSPFHPEAGLGKYKKDDFSRKPNPGMILQARTEYNIELGRSILIGDKLTDVNAGIAAGVGKNILVTKKKIKNRYFHSIENIAEAADFIKGVIS